MLARGPRLLGSTRPQLSPSLSQALSVSLRPCLPRGRSVSLGHVVTSTASSGSWVIGSAAAVDHTQQQQQQQHAEPSTSSDQPQSAAAGIVAVHHKTRTLFMILAGLAAWTYLSAGLSSSGPFASLSATMPTAGSGGDAALAAKSAWTGLATGIFHTLCGPDHLAGLAPLSIGRGRLAACALGTLWGFGHSTGQLILGVVFALLKDKFHDFMPWLDKWSSYIVPLTLITIGLVGLYESHVQKNEAASLEGDGAALSAAAKSGKRVGWTTYLTGIVHGLQPDALYVVIPALALPTKLATLSYISFFVIGTCAAMGGYTLFIGTTSKALIKEQPWLQSHLSTVACGFAILCGVLMLLSGQGISVPFFS